MAWLLDFDGVSVDAHKPTPAWRALSSHFICKRVEQSEMHREGYTFVCISDTHGHHRQISLPKGDVLVHTGDFSKGGTVEEVKDFFLWCSAQPFKHKIVIAGNHDALLHHSYYLSSWKRFIRRRYTQKELNDLVAFIRDLEKVHYLQDEGIELYGLKIYGSPWQPTFFNWAFNADRGESCAAIWKKIPSDIDILLTHGPPLGYGDLCATRKRAGCVDLLHHIQYRIRPRVHVFGHIHEGAGIYTDEERLYINASSCTLRYQPRLPPVSFSLLPE